MKKAHWFTDKFSDLVSSHWFFWGFIIATVAFMISQLLMKHPLDDPRAFFPFTILIYTLVGLWIENVIKVKQKEQRDEDQALLHEIAAEVHELINRAQSEK